MAKVTRIRLMFHWCVVKKTNQVVMFITLIRSFGEKSEFLFFDQGHKFIFRWIPLQEHTQRCDILRLKILEELQRYTSTSLLARCYVTFSQFWRQSLTQVLRDHTTSLPEPPSWFFTDWFLRLEVISFIAHSILDISTHQWPFPLLKKIYIYSRFIIKEEKLSTEKKKYILLFWLLVRKDPFWFYHARMVLENSKCIIT